MRGPTNQQIHQLELIQDTILGNIQNESFLAGLVNVYVQAGLPINIVGLFQSGEIPNVKGFIDQSSPFDSHLFVRHDETTFEYFAVLDSSDELNDLVAETAAVAIVSKKTSMLEGGRWRVVNCTVQDLLWNARGRRFFGEASVQ